MAFADRIKLLELDSLNWHLDLPTWEDIKATSWFTKANYANLVLLVIFLGFALLQIRSKVKEAEEHEKSTRFLPAPNFPPVKQQPGFDYKTTEPEQYRPFKPKYHLTMALENLDPNDLYVMDKNYADRIKYRKEIVRDHHDTVVNVTDDKRVGSAVRELYVFIMGTYLPMRFPTMFKLHETQFESGRSLMLENAVTGELFPAVPPRSMKTITLLETLARYLDEEFFFLLPEEDSVSEKDGIPRYVLHAYTCICASGFNPHEKLGKRLVDIHGPVPSYGDKLERSMDRYFNKLEVGKYVKRVNWSLSTGSPLFSAGGGTMHAHDGDSVEELEELDLDKTSVRVERQTLHRLPESKAIVFSFKTYMYPITQIKEEGLGPELADAIDGLQTGNAPGMHFYKRGASWGKAAKKYLSSK